MLETEDTTMKAQAFDAIAGLNEEKTKTWLAMQTAKEKYKSLKERYNTIQGEIDKVVHETAHPEETPLYNGPPAQTEAWSEEADGWRSMEIGDALGVRRLGDAGLKKPIIAKLEAAGITTMGEYSAYRQEHPLTDIPGIGEKAAEKIEAAEAAFWEWWRNSKAAAPENRISGLLPAPSGNGEQA